MGLLVTNLVLLQWEIPSSMCTKLRIVAASNNRDHASQSLLLLLAHVTHIYFCSSCTRTTPIARSLCEGWTQHNLHILVTAPFCCDRKSQVACAQSFAPRQQATVEIVRHNLSYYCLLTPHIHIFVLRTHPVRGESHNVTPRERLQQYYAQIKICS